MPEQDLKLAKSLASAGEELDLEIRTATTDLIRSFPNVSLFLIAISQSLIWTGHAVDKAEYFKKSLGFLTSGSEKALAGLSVCYGRYGSESLKSTLYNWRRLYGEFKVPADLSKSSIEELILFQKTAHKTACMARMKRRIMRVGAWLFCAPFKIILNLRNDLWKHERVDEIHMPLGIEVIRGVKKLIRKRHPYSINVDEGDLSEEEGNIVEGLGTVLIVQEMCKPIAKDAGSNVLHINSGLWRFGGGELK